MSAPDGRIQNGRTPRPLPYRRRLAWVLLLIAVVAVGRWAWPPDAPPITPSNDDTAGNETDPDPSAVNPGYVGPEACAECHARRVAEFKQTQHYSACITAGGTRSPGLEPGRNHFSNPWVQFDMRRIGGGLTATAIIPGAGPPLELPIKLVYGSRSNKDEDYFTWQDGEIAGLTLVWMYRENSWAYGHVGSAATRNISASCLDCHNTWIENVPGAVTRFSPDNMILGVSCERCHGPGREHIAHHQARPGDAARAIVHPGHLERERQIDVCAQCHATVRRRGPLFGYTPGQPLESHYRVVEHKYPEEEPVVNQVRSLRQSKCFAKSEMTCTTCHNPHRPAQSGQQDCLKCHQPASCREQPRIPAELRQDCIGCHMPSRPRTNVRYDTDRDRFLPAALRPDHRIAVYPEARDSVLLEWRRLRKDGADSAEARTLAERLSAHWIREAELRERDFRLIGTIDAMREAVRALPSEQNRKRLEKSVDAAAEFNRRLLALGSAGDPRKGLESLLAVRPTNPQVRTELGRLCLSAGETAEAERHFRRAFQDDPTDAYPLMNLASLAAGEGKWKEAEDMLTTADRIDPLNNMIQFGLASVVLRQGRWDRAGELFEEMLKAHPRHPGASSGLGEVRLRQGRSDEALTHARRGVRWSNPADAQSLLTLAEAYAAASKPEDAERTLLQALRVAEEMNSPLVPVIRQRLSRRP